jgi:phosphoribosylanthranilate isomerase
VAASEAGADAIGLVFYAPSPRAVDLAQARNILRVLPPFVTVVGLFVNPAREAVEEVLAALPLDLLQFHGDEDAAFCAGFARPYVKALRVRPDTDLPAAREHYASAQGLLLDAWHQGLYGGTGECFDWTLLQPLQGQARTILAGGLTPANVAAACRLAQPWAVDVSSGVESAPGLKSAALISQFIEEVHNV